MEEAWTVVFRNLYTGFLLRDFAGKIVPGMLLLFSIASMYRAPRQMIADLKKETPIFAILLVAGFAWTITLGTQSLAEGLRIWHYFPQGNGNPSAHFSVKDLFAPAVDQDFDRSTLEVDQFQRKATEDEKQQYERFVVIKEACGNMFVAGLLSLPAWHLGLWIRRHREKPRQMTAEHKKAFRTLVFAIYVFFAFVGLHRMHSQHVYNQINYAEKIWQLHKNDPPTSVQPKESSH
jgi:hypothetical protein